MFSGTISVQTFKTAFFDLEICQICHAILTLIVPIIVESCCNRRCFLRKKCDFSKAIKPDNLRLQRFFCTRKQPSDDKNDDKKSPAEFVKNRILPGFFVVNQKKTRSIFHLQHAHPRNPYVCIYLL